MVTDEIEIWRNRPVDEVYPIVYIDGIRIKVRDKGAVTIKVAHLVIGVDVDGRKHALGCWIAEAEATRLETQPTPAPRDVKRRITVHFEHRDRHGMTRIDFRPT